MKTSTAEFETLTAALIQQRNDHVGEAYGWADYEIRSIKNEGGFADHATSALGFSEEHFGMQDTNAVSCDVCGGLFKESLDVMRRHRYRCGWDK